MHMTDQSLVGPLTLSSEGFGHLGGLGAVLEDEEIMEGLAVEVKTVNSPPILEPILVGIG